MLKRSFLAVMLCIICTSAPAQKEFTFRTVSNNLWIPWEIAWGSDGMLWATERPGIVSRINPETGEKHVVLDIQDVVWAVGEAGMLGMTFHPDFPDAPYIYIAYVVGTKTPDYKVVMRYEYVEDTLVEPVELFRITPSHMIHQGCRLHIGPDKKLYVTMGDHPTDWPVEDDSTLIGKILRMNLDGTVPLDNPVPGELMWSKGHRNVQGIVRLPNGNLWACEHGNVIEDEVNLIVKGANYGWPFVEGVCDEDYELEYCDSAKPNAPKWSSGQGTVAPCGLDYYNHDRYPALKNSLLMATLKNSTLFQFKLNVNGTVIAETIEHFNRSMGRIRDIAISPDGRVFICSSNREPNGYLPYPLADDDRIVELIPVGDSTFPVYSAPDTVKVKARPGDEYFFSIPIANTGSSAFRIDYLWNFNEDSPIRTAQWRIPIVLLPQMSYSIDMLFSPPTEGVFTGQVIIGTNNSGEHSIELVGDTHVGLLKPKQDTILAICGTSEITHIAVRFINKGTDTITVTDAFLEGLGSDAFAIESVETGILEPDDTCIVMVAYTPRGSDLTQCVVRVVSTSYRPASTTIYGSTSTSVAESDVSYRLSIFPNPTTDDVSVIIPDELLLGELRVVDVLGCVVWSEQCSNRSVIHLSRSAMSDNISHAGTYLVVVTDGRHRASQRLQFFEQ